MFDNDCFVIGSGIVVTKSANVGQYWWGSPRSPHLRNDDDVFMQTPALQSSKELAYWGFDNYFPQNIIGVSLNNSITPGLLNFKANTLQKGLYLYEEQIVGGKREKVELIDTELEDWLEEVDIEKYILGASQDAVYLMNVFAELIFSRGGGKVVGFARLDASNCRVSTDYKTAFVYSNWDKIGFGYNSDWAFPLVQKAGKVSPAMVYHSKNNFPGAMHYGVAPWIGSLNWLKMANEIPIYKWASIKNGFSIKYHIEMPANYFTELYPNSHINPATGKNYNELDRQGKERELKRQMNDFLAGAENAGKAFYSKFAIGPDGKPMAGWKITPIEDKTKYNAYLEDFNTSNQAITSAHNINPSLASVNTEGKLSSGSEMRNAFNIFNEISLNSEKKLILEPLLWAKNYNFPDKKRVKIGFKTVELTTTEAVKSGMVEQSNN